MIGREQGKNPEELSYKNEKGEIMTKTVCLQMKLT
jgi:hypothetical protein